MFLFFFWRFETIAGSIFREAQTRLTAKQIVVLPFKPDLFKLAISLTDT